MVKLRWKKVDHTTKLVIKLHDSESLQGKHLVAKVFTELPRQIYPFLFIAEVDSGGRWLEVFAVVF